MSMALTKKELAELLHRLDERVNTLSAEVNDELA
jgi:hypothetical protein